MYTPIITSVITSISIAMYAIWWGVLILFRRRPMYVFNASLKRRNLRQTAKEINWWNRFSMWKFKGACRDLADTPTYLPIMNKMGGGILTFIMLDAQLKKGVEKIQHEQSVTEKGQLLGALMCILLMVLAHFMWCYDPQAVSSGAWLNAHTGQILFNGWVISLSCHAIAFPTLRLHRQRIRTEIGMLRKLRDSIEQAEIERNGQS